ncbi:MAG: phytanoyl-CoA dioxygenase family protein [Pseudomonadota bacterium]
MALEATQVEEFREKGWIVIPSAFDGEDVSILKQAVATVSAHEGPEVAREPTGEPHVVYGMHLLDQRFAALAHHPAIVKNSEQLLGKQIFVHQSRVNVKQTGGSIVKWHQDFGTYHRVDGLPTPEGIMVGVFLNEVTACNAPVMGIPGSHKHGIVSKAFTDSSSRDFGTVSKYRYDIPPETIRDLVEQHGLEAITGPAGSLLLMDMTVVHGSTINITPLERVILYINVSTVNNRGETYERPEYYAARDFSPLVAANEDCLKQHAQRA